MKKLKVTQIFYSLQGEATYSGVACIFIRLFGCNLACSFCDDLLHTDKNSIKEYTYGEIKEKIKQYPSKNIIITGGEPSIYKLNNFIDFLKNNQYYVAIETNGYKFENIKNANWITYSPKDWENIHIDNNDEYKFIINTTTNIQPILELNTLKPIYIQPENDLHKPNIKNVNHCIELVKKYPHLKLSVQMHKFVGIL